MSSQRKVVRKHATRARHGRDDHVCSGIPPPAQAGSSFKPCGHNLAGSAAACGPPGDGKPLDLTQLSSEQRSKLESFLKSSGFGPLPKAGQTLDAATMRKLAQHMRAAAAMPSKTPLRNWGDTEKNPKDGLVRQAVTNSKRDDVKNLLEEGGDVDEAEPKTLCTPLMLAVRDGSKEIVQLLLDYDADVTRRDKDGKTAIMEACAAGRDDLVQLLIDHGSCVADTDNSNWNSLTHAAANGHIRCAEVVMRHLKYDKETQERLKEVVKKEEKKKKPKEKGKTNDLDDYDEAETAAESALAIAAQKGQYEFVKWYLGKKEQFKASEAEIQAACSRACYSKRLDLVRLVVEDYGAKVNPEGPVMETPLCAAAACGDADIVKYLLARGARVNDSDASGFTPLMRACNEGNSNLVPVLLHHEANVNAQNAQEDNSTPLCYAVRKGNLDIVRTLVSAQANVNLGGTPSLLLAISMSNAEAVEYLLANGANPVQKSSHNDTALAFAAEVGNFELVKQFHALGCDVDCVGEKGSTPLMRAAKKGSLEIIEYLLNNGASINRTSSNNDCTALSLACSKGWIKIIEFLLERGANRHSKLKDNVTPLLEAVKSGNSEAADLVLYYQPKNAEFREPTSVALPLPGVRGAPNMPAPVNEFYMHNYACKHCDGHHGDQMLRASDDSTDEEDEDDEDDVDEDDDDDQEGVYNEDMDEECETGDEDDEEMHDDEDDYTSDDQSNDEDKKDLENYELPDILPGDLVDLDFPQSDSYDIKEGLDADIDFIRNQLAHFQPQSFEFRILNAMLRKAEQLQVRRIPVIAAFNQILTELLQKSLPNHTPEELRRRFSEEISRWQNELQSNSNVDDLMEKLGTESTTGREEDLPVASDEPTLHDIATFLQANPSLQDYSSLLLQRHAEMFPPDSHPLTDSEGKEIKRGMSLSPDGKYIVMTSSNTNFTAPLGTEFELLRSIAAAADANPTLGSGLDNLPEDLAKVMAEARNKGVFNMEAFSTFLRGAREDERFLEATRVPSTFNFSTTTPPASLVASSRPLEKLRKYAPKKMLDGRIPRTPEPTPDDTSEEGFQGSDDVPPMEAKQVAACKQMPRILKKAIRSTRDASTNVTSTVPPPKKPALVEVDQQLESDASTALIQAAIRGNAKIIAMLCDAGAKPNHKDKKGWTALGYAVERGHKDAVKELCDHGADIDGVMDTNQAKRDSSLTIACYNGRVEIVRILLEHKANIEHKNSNDYTPLCVACLNGHHRVAQLLIQRGADINARGTKLGIAPLMLAAMNGHTTIVKLLIENSADVNQCIETNRNTALTLACFQGRTECVRVLVEKGANLEWRSKNGLNAMMEAANGGFFEIGKILVEAGAEVNCAPVPSTKDTPLTIAAEKGHAKFVQLLIDNDAAINVRNKKGCSPLWLACQNGHLDCVRALVASGRADVDARDNRQMSCILTAFKRGHENIVKILVDHIRCYPSEEEMTRYCKDVKLTGTNNYLSAVFERCKKAILDAKHKKEAEADAKARSLLEELDLQQKAKEGQRAKKRDKKKQKKKTGKNDDDDSSVTGTSNARTNESEPNSKYASPSHSRSGSTVRQDLPLAPVNGKAFEEVEEPDDDDAKSKKRKKKKTKKTKTVSAPETTNVTQVVSIPAVIPRKGSIPELAAAASNLIKQVNLHEADRNGKIVQKGKMPAAVPVKEVPAALTKTDFAAGKRPATAPASQVPEPVAESDDDGTDENENYDRGVDADEWVQQRSKSQKISGASHGPQIEKLELRRAPANATIALKQEGWKEVVGRSKRFKVPTAAIARIIGKGGQNINAIRASTMAHIEIEKNKPGINERLITVKGTSEAVAEAYHIIQTLSTHPDRDLEELLSETKRDSAALAHALRNDMQPAAVPTGPNVHPSAVIKQPQHHAPASESEKRHKPGPHFHGASTTMSTQVFTNSQIHRTPAQLTPTATVPPPPPVENYSSVLASNQKRSSIHSTSSKESSSQESGGAGAPRAVSATVDRDVISPALSAGNSGTSTSNRGSPSSSITGLVPTSSWAPTQTSSSHTDRTVTSVTSRNVQLEGGNQGPAPRPATSAAPPTEPAKTSPTQPAKPQEGHGLFGTLYKDLMSERHGWNVDVDFFAKDLAPPPVVQPESASQNPYHIPKESRILRAAFDANSTGFQPDTRPSPTHLSDVMTSSYQPFPSTRPSSLPPEPRMNRMMNGDPNRYGGMNGFISPTGFPSGGVDGFGNFPGIPFTNGDPSAVFRPLPHLGDMDHENGMWMQNGFGGMDDYSKDVDNEKLMGLAATLAEMEQGQHHMYNMDPYQRRMPFAGNGYMEAPELGFGDAGPNVPVAHHGSRLLTNKYHSDIPPVMVSGNNSFGWNGNAGFFSYGSNNMMNDNNMLHNLESLSMPNRSNIRSGGNTMDPNGNLKTSPQYSGRDRQPM